MTITQPSLCMLVLSLEDNIRARDFISHHGTNESTPAESKKRGEYTVVVNQMRWKEIFQRWTEKDDASRCSSPTRRFTFFGEHERMLNPTPEWFAKSSKRGIYSSDTSLGQFF